MPRVIAFIARNSERLVRKVNVHTVGRRPKRGRYRMAT